MSDKHRIYILATVLPIMIAMWVMGYYTGKANCKKPETKMDTVTLYLPDTSNFIKPQPKDNRPTGVKIKYIVPEKILDSLAALNDSLKAKPKFIYLPRTQSMYKDTSYQAWVSGVQPELDSIKVFKKTVVKTITVTNTIEVKAKRKPKPFGIGVQVGYGWNGEKLNPFVGIGVSYNFIRF